MNIVSGDIYFVNPSPKGPGFNPVILRLLTDDGLEGIGELALAYGVGGEAGVGMLKQMVERFVIGTDARRVENMWHTLYRHTFWGQGGGPVIYGGISAIDEALWDIKGKAAGLPAYELLGGPTRDALRVYANGWYTWTTGDERRPCNAPEEYAHQAAMAVQDGYDALKFDPFAVTPEGVWSYPERNLPRARANLAEARVAAVREAVGPDVDILIEVHGVLGTTSAIEMGRSLAQYDPFFYEEPVDAMNVACMKKVSENVPIPIAAGERLYTRYGFREYIEQQALDILQPDMGLAGGLSEVKKIAAYAETYDLHVQPHRYGGPIATAASVQLDACITNFIIQEWHPYEPQGVYDLLVDPLEGQVVDGRLAVPTSPGLGVTLNHEVVDRYPCIHIA